MRRRLVWLVALAGLVWLYLRRGGRKPQPVGQVPPAAAPAVDPAEELRRKLEETKSRSAEPEAQAEPSAVETAVLRPVETLEPPAPVVSEELDAKRRSVHERARSAAAGMQDADTATGTSSEPDLEPEPDPGADSGSDSA